MSATSDVLVIGGGPAGTAAALSLAACGARVTVLERTQYDQARVGETLPPIAQRPLVRLGVWDEFVHAGHAPSPATVSVWGTPEPYEEHFIASPYGSGWHLDRARFDRMLAQRAEAAGARLEHAARVTGSHEAAGGWQIDVNANGRPKTLRARFVVDATGRASSWARQRGARRIVYDRLIGIVGLFTGDQAEGPLDNRTLVEAVEDGWWYSAWLPNCQLIVAFMTDADLRPVQRAQPASYWQKQLVHAPHTRERVSRGAASSALRIVAADTYRLNRLCGERWLCVGDAACGYDPLSSLGLCNALESGTCAAQQITDMVNGQRGALTGYEKWMQARFDEYLQGRQLSYAREQRWSASTFWKRRHVGARTALQ